MCLNERLALSNGNPEKTILALRLINQQLKRKLSECVAVEEAKLVEVEYQSAREDGRVNNNHNGKGIKTRILLERVARSDGNLQRTITSSRLLNEHLAGKLSLYSEQSAVDLRTLTAILDKELERVKVKSGVEINGRVKSCAVSEF